MSLDSDIRGIFAGSAAVTAIVGDKIYPDELPPEKLPAVVFITASTPEQLLDGSICADQVRVRVEGWAKTKGESRALGDALVAALAAADVPYEARAPLYDADTGEFGAGIDFIWWVL